MLWFRRDLRLADNHALLAAAGDGDVLPLFVLDEALRRPAGAARITFLYGCLRELDSALGGRLVVLRGSPANVVPRVTRAGDASAVPIAADYGPYGAARDRAVEKALGDVPLVRTGSPYAVAPGRVRKDDGDPFRVFTPYSRAWARHGWRAPAESAGTAVRWATGVDSTGIPADPRLPAGLELPAPGEDAATRRRTAFLDGVGGYGEDRNRPDLPAGSRPI